jgi:type VI secretion system FHA domain protein
VRSAYEQAANVYNQHRSIESSGSELKTMILTLQVVGDRAQDMGGASRKVFKAIGGTLGRLPDNDWVFADPYVSGRHALIRYVNGKFFIEDTSTNGIYINSHENRLPRAQAHPLIHGDRLFIDTYEIEVSIAKDPAARSRHDPFADPRTTHKSDKTAGSSGEDHTASFVLDDVEEFDEFEDVDAANATQWHGQASKAKPETPEPQPLPSVQSPMTRPVPSIAGIPKEAAAKSSVAPAKPGNPDLQTLLAAAGIEGLDPTSETAQVLGEVLRTSVNGLMEVLRARERIKDELRMRGTTFKAANNNPLKFSANVDDAFHNLLVKRNPAYLPPAEAFEDAYRDVRDHQTAVMLAMRLAFEAMLARFDPARLQEEFDRHLKKGSILGVPAKLRYWDLFRERYGETSKDADASFRKLFGDEFAKAYEEQLARLKAQGH